MNDDNKKFIENLKKILIQSSKEDKLFTAGNYWKFYEKNILRQVKNNDISKLRSWQGGAGIGNIQSFGGGSEFKGRNFLRHFHPLDKEFNFLDNSFIVKKYNSFINKLLPYFPFLKFILFRASELKIYYTNLRAQKIKEKYNLIKLLDKDLLNISDSKFGLNSDEFITIEDKIYTDRFLNDLFKINFVKENTDFNSIDSIVELGAGIGLLASAFLKLKKKLKYLIVDIPPALCFSSYFLKNLGFKVFDFEDLHKLDSREKINLKDIYQTYDVVCLPTWMLNRLGDYKFDLFVNVASFQEMEKEQVYNYLSIFEKHLKKYIFLCYVIKEKKKATTKGSFGVLEPLDLDQIENFLIKNFDVRKKDLTLRGDHRNIIFNKKY